MVERSPAALDLTYAALADPTRRAILERLRHADARVTEVAGPLPMSLAAVSKHIAVLEAGWLVHREVRGRDHYLRADPVRLTEAEQWIAEYTHFWEHRADALADHLEQHFAKSEQTKTGQKENMVTDPMTDPVRNSADSANHSGHFDGAAGDSDSGIGVVSITRTLKASPEEVFDAWTNADRMKLWLYPAPGIYAEADCNPVVGGRYRLVKVFDWGAHVVSGEFLVVEPPHRLVFTWAVDDWGPGTRPSQITVTLLPDGDATEMTIVHEQLPSRNIFGGAKLAWVSVLGRLEETLRTS